MNALDSLEQVSDVKMAPLASTMSEDIPAPVLLIGMVFTVPNNMTIVARPPIKNSADTELALMKRERCPDSLVTAVFVILAGKMGATVRHVQKTSMSAAGQKEDAP
ncbi:hypothetical protein TNCV_3840321 [Trichonephila clavipes]|nr:hypothetical protein TNCV_3840321 [Trichonephila clavipes]